MASTSSKRIASIDVLRALTMILMLWVNDFAGMSGIPHWMKHAAMSEDMLGFSDLIFPTFLFCVGLSIPFAIENRFRKGDSVWKVLLHIIERSVALLVMGLFAMNCSGIEGFLPGPWFKILMVIGFFLIWNNYDAPRKPLALTLKGIGIALLTALVVFRLTHGLPIKAGWWGILGLIGWAYLFSSLIYMLTRRSEIFVCIAFALVVACVILCRKELPWLGKLPGGWTHVGLAFGGVLAGTLMKSFKQTGKDRVFVLSALLLAIICLLAAIFSHRIWIISKIQATPTWMFYSLAISLSLTALFYWLTDMKRVDLQRTYLKTAGTATLTCYLLPTIWYAVQQLLGLSWPAALSAGVPGLCRSMLFAFIIVLIAWLIGKFGIKLKI